MKGTMANDDHEEETGDVGGLTGDKDLNPLKGTISRPGVSFSTPMTPLTTPTAMITPPEAKSTDAVKEFASPAGVQTSSAGVVSDIERENSTVTPTTLQNVQISQTLKLKQQKSNVVNGKTDSASEETDLSSPQNQFGAGERPKGRTSEAKTEIGENLGLQQPDRSIQNDDPHLSGLEGSTTNRSKHLQESLGILDPGGPTIGPKDSQLTTLSVHPTNSTKNVNSVGIVLTQTPKTETKHTIKVSDFMC